MPYCPMRAWLSRRNNKVWQKASENSPKKQSGHKSQTQTWYTCWISESTEINVVNVLRALEERVDNTEEHMNNVTRKMEALRKNQKRNTGSQKHHQRMKNTLDELIRRLNTAKERISETGRQVNRNFLNWNTKRKKHE